MIENLWLHLLAQLNDNRCFGSGEVKAVFHSVDIQTCWGGLSGSGSSCRAARDLRQVVLIKSTS